MKNSIINYKIIQQFNQYFQERFSLGKFLALSFIFGINISFLSQYFIWGHLQSARSIFYTALALFLFLVRLRLWDEIKDNEHDKIYYPNRPIARGLLPIKFIWRFSFLILFMELVISILGGIVSFVFFIILLSYSFLMLKEFLAREWLRSRFTMYIIAHELSIVPLFFYLISLNVASFSSINNAFFYLFVFCLGCETFLIEIVRKTRISEQENQSRDTYISQYGKKVTSTIICILGVFIIIVRFYLFVIIGKAFWIWVILSTLAFLMVMLNLIKFIKKEDDSYIKNINNYAVCFVMLMNISFLSLII